MINLRAALVTPLLETLQGAAQDLPPNALLLSPDELSLLRKVLAHRLAVFGVSESHQRGDWEKIRTLTQVLEAMRGLSSDRRPACLIQLSSVQGTVIRDALVHAEGLGSHERQPVRILHRKLARARGRRAGFMASLKRLLGATKEATM